ncbi:MAG: hypothetical protein HPY90_05745 [Syntrophothermus sp.]|nr:hypothetical protein [Syntrophothermus sp.]
MLPEMREKAAHTCGECRFFVEIQGREETRFGCVVSIPRYGSLERRVPQRIHALDIIRLVGKEGLMKIISRGCSLSQACSQFRQK